MTDQPGDGDGRGRRWAQGRDQQWLLALLPAFPLVLLVLRLWYLSRQDLPTMLLLVQYVSPLGLVSALMITLMWVVPAVVLVGRALGALLWVSAGTEAEAARSGLTRVSLRVPNWVVALAAGQAALTWQLRFLPALLMLTLVILALVVRGRGGAGSRRVLLVGVVAPVLAAGIALAWLAPGIAEALRAGERVTALLLALPPVGTVLLTGPVPAGAARLVTHWVAIAAALLTPFVVGAVFLHTPILPTVAIEIDAEPTGTQPTGTQPTGAAQGGAGSVAILRGRVITVDDRMTTILDGRGIVRFVPNDRIRTKTLCAESDEVPFSVVSVRGWPVEQPALEWLAGRRPPAPTDPRCQGRPLHP